MIDDTQPIGFRYDPRIGVTIDWNLRRAKIDDEEIQLSKREVQIIEARIAGNMTAKAVVDFVTESERQNKRNLLPPNVETLSVENVEVIWLDCGVKSVMVVYYH